MLLWLLLSACWSPDPTLAPELPALEDAPGDAPTDDAPTEDAPADAAPIEENGAEADAPDTDPPDEAPTENAADAPDAPAFSAYSAFSATSPVTIVDDFGKPLSIIPKLGIVVEVRDEQSIRKRIYCAACQPATEGWVQSVTVTGRGEPAPRTSQVFPPGAPPPGMAPGG